MHELAYLNGEYLPAGDLRVSVDDWGFVQGLTLAERLRTFGGELFQVDRHLARLLDGARWLGWDQLVADRDLQTPIERVARHNYQRIDPHDDLGVCLFLTPGTHPDFGAQRHDGPTVGVHSYPLPFHAWHGNYTEGVPVITVGTRQVPGECWPAQLKCRSRMHYYLAAREAERLHPGATPLLLDQQGFATETPAANVIAYFADAGFVSPMREKILAGVSLGYLIELAAERGISTEFRDMTPAELATADELLLTSTPFCVLPVARFNDRPLNCPGPQFRDLLGAWSQRVGVDIAAQAGRFAARR